jgi:hypothetical protein
VAVMRRWDVGTSGGHVGGSDEWGAMRWWGNDDGC